MTIHELPGEYFVDGTNQDQGQSSYKGILRLELDENEKVLAEWTIGENQSQFGTGFFKDDILVLNFYYLTNEAETLKGVVVYRFVNKNELNGFWSEKYGDQRFLGSEKCSRVNPFGKFSEN